MSLPVVYLPQADDDINTTHADYEQQLAGLGDRFLVALRELIDRIGNNSQLYCVIRSRRIVSAAPIQGLPHVVYYQDRAADLLIVAVQHGRRSFRAWRGRI